MNYRIFVEKKELFDIEARSLLSDFVENLQMKSLKKLRLLNVYDVFGISQENLEKAKKTIFAEMPTDEIYDEMALEGKNYFAVEYLPGQFDQRADSAVQCLELISDSKDTVVKSGKLLILEGELTANDIQEIKKYYINPVESREKNINAPLQIEALPKVEDVKTFDGFINYNAEELENFRAELGLAMSAKDIVFVQEYFKNTEKRDPVETEIKVLDTYWSDHCRHTTFETELTNIVIPSGKFYETIQKTYEEYLQNRTDVHNNKKPLCLMDMATITMKRLRKEGKLEDLEVSDEINACSVRIKVDVDGVLENWLLMFKNETHNHPTEIEPFGGASTCIGGAIRDPLSGRSYVYQAMRVTGSANPNEKIEDTMSGKLPQRVITTGAAHGYSSYGNQIGLATTYVKELYDQGYKAKRMEVGAVVGAVKEEWVKREKPEAGDIIILLGGKTGRDGCGGATGSSKEHNTDSIVDCSAEVQKGNAPVERKIQRFFRNEEVTSLIKKCNDFGAGGVSVAIGELADGLNIDLDKVPVKYSGLNGTELAISESQERMAVVIRVEDKDKFIKMANLENIEAVHVAEVTAENRLVMKWQGKTIVDLSRDFLDTNGVRSEMEAEIEEITTEAPFVQAVEGETLKDKFINNLKRLNVSSQKGLVEMFDATIGATTVLMPYGGKYQLSETEGSVQKLPMLNGETKTASIMTFGYNSEIAKWSPFHGAAYAVIESISKVVALGGNWEGIRFSFQEYFQRLGADKKKWGKPFSALLGTLYVQNGFDLPAIGGKDSMSGTFNELDVPPTLISFAVNTESTDNVISTELKGAGNNLYLVKHVANEDYTPNIELLKNNFSFIYKNVKTGKIVSASTLKYGGVAEAVAKMSFGNKLGADITVDEKDLFSMNYGSIVIEATEELVASNGVELVKLGTVVADEILKINNTEISIDEAIEAWKGTLEGVFKSVVDEEKTKLEVKDYGKKVNIISKGLDAKPRVFIPVFPGTNCEYDSAKVFNNAGAIANTMVFKNQNTNDIKESIEAMKKYIETSQILMFAGGFSAGDEPDGSGKFIANVLQNAEIKESVEKFLAKDGLILGICNGFQALVKSGLLPYGKIGEITAESPTLARNSINRHISKIIKTRITSTNSPWLADFNTGDIHEIAVSHGEGRFVANDQLIAELFKNGQVATQYVDFDGIPTMNGEFNPNGSYHAIEGIMSPDGKIFGKMGHSERVGDNVFKNIIGNKEQAIFKSGVKYFK